MNETELLFTEVFNCDKLSLYLKQEHYLDKIQANFVTCALIRRLTGEPIQYILGKTEFMGFEFKVNKDVLIPRPETEILVEMVLDLVRSSELGVRSILEIGTGSGCIAISLAKLLKDAKITATDISKETLKIARENAKLNSVNISFIQGDLFGIRGLAMTNYDLIVSNPPYIATDDIRGLQPEVRFEPVIALDGGRDGLDFYRRIINDAPSYLSQEGVLAMEIGLGQRRAIANIFKARGAFKIIEVVKDYNGIDRVIVAKKTKT